MYVVVTDGGGVHTTGNQLKLQSRKEDVMITFTLDV